MLSLIRLTDGPLLIEIRTYSIHSTQPFTLSHYEHSHTLFYLILSFVVVVVVVAVVLFVVRIIQEASYAILVAGWGSVTESGDKGAKVEIRKVTSFIACVHALGYWFMFASCHDVFNNQQTTNNSANALDIHKEHQHQNE